MKWIPVEEALPKSQNEYLVTVNFDGDTYVECLHYGKPLMANREVKGECFYDSDDEWGDVVYDTGTEVIAWMPLPQPYKADRKTEPNLILPERMERGERFEVGETIVVMNRDDYYDLLCKSWKDETHTDTHDEAIKAMATLIKPKTEPQTEREGE